MHPLSKRGFIDQRFDIPLKGEVFLVP